MSHGIDLHMHSTASDGSCTPRELARLCKQTGLNYCALTDHDTTFGVAEYIDEAKKIGLRAITGIEFSAKYSGELHILGYGVDIDNPELKAALYELAKSRRTRSEKMVKKLNENGYDIDIERVKQIAGAGVIGRPHIGQALVEKGYISSVEEAFSTLVGKGGAGYVERHSVTKKQAVELILKAGGIPVFAHPGITNHPEPEQLVDELVSYGVKGIEVFYPTHDDKTVEKYYAMARERGLLVTCGSDFHGLNRAARGLYAERRGDTYLKKSVEQIFDFFC